jgi:hypothetical protein
LSPWWRRRQVPTKRRFLQEPHGVTTQKTPFLIVTAVETSNLTCLTHERKLINVQRSNRLGIPKQSNVSQNLIRTQIHVTKEYNSINAIVSISYFLLDTEDDYLKVCGLREDASVRRHGGLPDQHTPLSHRADAAEDYVSVNQHKHSSPRRLRYHGITVMFLMRSQLFRLPHSHRPAANREISERFRLHQ